MPKIFISYRRSDAGYVAHQIANVCKEHFGEQSVFIDIVEIERGAEFPKVIAEALDKADVLLPIIGARWLDARFKDGPLQGQRRLDDPDDFVRREIASALQRGIGVLPIVIEGVSLSAIGRELPPDLEGLRRINEIHFRSGYDLGSDAVQLVHSIKGMLLPPLKAEDLALPPGVQIAPQGLRSFDAGDRAFFCHLLPDPINGIPKQIAIWKARIDPTDASEPFRVGLIYGPSGCGKSSIVKAGLLPQLSPRIKTAYIEARGQGTEAGLLSELHRLFVASKAHTSLQSALAAPASFLGPGEKLLIVIDQFEQYLHATFADEQALLANALRQCDGERTQCLLMIRDDFLTPITRFMDRVGIALSSSQNMSMMDLFNKRHAKKVLALLGQGYGGLPVLRAGEVFSNEQNDFLNQAITEMADGDHVIPVRIALFAQMFRDKVWSTTSLSALGGTSGVGVSFLEDSLGANASESNKRNHERAAQRILASLLPESGTTIKGSMRSQADLLKLSSYSSNPSAFDELIEILDKGLRLVTPTQSAFGSSEKSKTSSEVQEKYFQLTHDYLVPAVREWLAWKQKETRRGRAELLLADRSTLWNARKESRQLPTLVQWLAIQWFTDKNDWTPAQKKMMGVTGRAFAVRGAVAVLVAGVVASLGFFLRSQSIEADKQLQATGLVQRLLDAETARVPTVISEMIPYRNYCEGPLREAHSKAKDFSKAKLHASLALLSEDPDQIEYLYSCLLEANPSDVRIIVDSLAPYQSRIVDRLWGILSSPVKSQPERTLRAATALAAYASDDTRWSQWNRIVAEVLASTNPFTVKEWTACLKPISKHIIASLQEIYSDVDSAVEQRLTVANILADYASNEPTILASLLMDGNEAQFKVIFPAFKEQPTQVHELLVSELRESIPDSVPISDSKRERLAHRQTNAAIALMRLGQPKWTFELLAFQKDSRVRSNLIHRLQSLGVEAEVIIDRIMKTDDADVSIVRALYLCLGEYGDIELSDTKKESLRSRVYECFLSDDAGLHAAAEWLLRVWNETNWLDKAFADLRKDRKRRDAMVAKYQDRSSDETNVDASWYINSQGQTMVVIPGPVQFRMGSPLSEHGRKPDEVQHERRIPRTFAIGSHLVTKEEYLRFSPDFDNSEMSRFPEPNCPIGGITWHEAAEYCNWLSLKEGIEPSDLCYEIVDHEVVRVKDNYLSLSSYRMPTEAELEYATRAGTITSRFFGETETLLPKYAWYIVNSKDRTWPIGLLKPNDLGIFDAHGHLWAWCQNSFTEFDSSRESVVIDDVEDDILSRQTRGLRGGSFVVAPSSLRSAMRNSIEPASRFSRYGIRLARTIKTTALTE